MSVRVLPILLALPALAAAGDRVAVPVRLEETVSADASPLVVFPEVRFELTARRPAGLDGVPKLSEDARYAAVVLGGRPLPLAFEAPPGALALGQLYTPGLESPAIARARADGKDGLVVDFRDVPAGAVRIDVRLVYRGLKDVSASLVPARHRRGRASVAGVVREVVLVDADGDGRYDGKEDRWVALRADRAKATPALRRPEALLLGEPQVPFEKDGRALTVEEVKRDGSALTLVLDKPRRTLADVLARRAREVRATYYRRFDSERAVFAAKQGLDPSRPAVDGEAAPWRSIPLSKARTLAAESGRPLLVLFVSESNPWCYRYDYYTFRDKEVDALLRRFLLVRIDVEKDPEGSYRRSGGRGLPALVPLTKHGGNIEFRVRVKKPDGRVEDLALEERSITGWQRPRELVVNLRRMLDVLGE